MKTPKNIEELLEACATVDRAWRALTDEQRDATPIDLSCAVGICQTALVNASPQAEVDICASCGVRPVDSSGWCSKCGQYTCLKCNVAMRRRDLMRRSAGFQCPTCNLQRFD